MSEINKLTGIRIKEGQQVSANVIPIGVTAENVEIDSSNTLQSILGNIDFSQDGDLGTQIENIYTQINNNKSDQSTINTSVQNSLSSLSNDKLNESTFDTFKNNLKNRSNSQSMLSAAALFDIIYPLGSLYLTSSSTFDPNTITGEGTWVSISYGRVLMTQGTGFPLGQMGGYSDVVVPEHNHLVPSQTISSSGQHSHTITTKIGNPSNSGSNGYVGKAMSSTTTSTSAVTVQKSTGGHTHTVGSHYTNTAGTTRSNANFPPYLVVRVWRRVSMTTPSS